ncbi:hypothetical protein TrST_g10394 [Triparma strigata]|uniref:Uncharacterized protein n=1 Tax=Triparma strigata TaxID=1606541 RepID=A0A9W7F3E8_9STRA|nr:hypothetical protein TrST_g10394 [Triparma strigata]
MPSAKSPPSPLSRSYSAQFSTPDFEALKLSSNSNITWTFNPISSIIYIFMILIVHIFISTNLDAYLHGNFDPQQITNDITTLSLGLGKQLGKDGTRIWYADAWNITACIHAVSTWFTFHWIKGSANFYDQGELGAMTWYEQLSSSPNADMSWYSYRFLVGVPTFLAYLAVSMSDYNHKTCALNVVLLAVLVVSKQGWMTGVRLLGINRTVGIDDNTMTPASSVQSEMNKKLE